MNLEAAIASVSEGGDSLQFMTDDLRSKREVVEAAVEVNALALEYAAPQLGDDDGLVMRAISVNGEVLHSDRIRRDVVCRHCPCRVCKQLACSPIFVYWVSPRS